MRGGLHHGLRLCKIGWVLARHDALFWLPALGAPAWLCWLTRRLAWGHPGVRPGARLAQALQALGPSFIKAGQALSTRADVIGEELAADLSTLQDRVPPFAVAQAIATVEAQLGAPVASLFSAFEQQPIAAASIAQVHFAVTPDGREVAVKILRPGVEEAFARDIALMRWLAGKLSRYPGARRFKPVEVVETFAATIAVETDLRLEAAAADELRENSRDDPDFYVPTIDWQRTARRVMVSERIRGISVGDVAALKAAGIDLDRTMERAARAFFNQVFRDGFFHADMHPGNLFVLPDGRLAPVDFGIMGRIDHATQLIMAQILWALVKGDYLRVAQLHREAGFIPPHVSIALFAQAARAVGSPILGKPLHEISAGKILGQVMAIARMFEMETQPHLLLLQKTMVTAEGIGRALNPTLNMWQLTEPHIRAWVRKNLSARAQMRDFAGGAFDTLRQAPQVLQELRAYLDALRAHEKPAAPAFTPPMPGRVARPRSSRALWVIAALLAAQLALALYEDTMVYAPPGDDDLQCPQADAGWH